MGVEDGVMFSLWRVSLETD